MQFPRFFMVTINSPGEPLAHGSRIVIDVDEVFAVSENKETGCAFVEFKNPALESLNTCEPFDDVVMLLNAHGISRAPDRDGEANGNAGT